MESSALQHDKRNLTIIGVLSVVIPVAVAVLLFYPSKLEVSGGWTTMLPGLNAVMNSSTSLALIVGLIFIKKGNIAMHRISMLTAFALGAIFLISYIIHHVSMPSTSYGDLDSDGVVSAVEKAQAGSTRLIYFVILISHILLAIIVVPFVLLALYFAVKGQIERHKKIVKYAYPIWLYVSVTGVIIYLMISPYYPWNLMATS